jgi:hypothetical protein
MILTGVIGGVIVIIAIAMVIILCQRREKKPEGKEFALFANVYFIILVRGEVT